MTKPRLAKVRALFYVLQQLIKRGCAYFDTASIFLASLDYKKRLPKLVSQPPDFLALEYSSILKIYKRHYIALPELDYKKQNHNQYKSLYEKWHGLKLFLHT